MPEDLNRDPIAERSLSGPMLVAALLLFLSLVWALYDELIGDRPWKRYQTRDIAAYSAYLKRLRVQQGRAEKAVFSSPEFQKIEQQLQSVEKAVSPKVGEIERELGRVRQQLGIIKDPFQDARARIAALAYNLDHTDGARGKNSIREEIADVKKGPFKVALPGAPASGITFDELEKRFNDLKAREAQLVAEEAELTKEARELRKRRGEYLSDHLVGLSQQQIDGLLKKMDDFTVEIKQINVPEAGIVDRCESCHVNIREPLVLTAKDMGGRRLFVSHPEKELLALHNPERFGCTPCHNGNGLATASAREAHGHYEHWLWPMFARENTEAGCLQCHFNDRELQYAPVLNRGRDLFQLKGCVGCHRHQEFDRESDALTDVTKSIQTLELQQKEQRLEADREVKLGDQAETNDEAQRHYAKAEALKLTSSGLDARIGELQQQSKFLLQDQKKVGPNLKDVRLKLRKEWIPVWLKDPPAFRPGTKMPKFRLAENEIRAISAYIWQSGWDGPAVEKQGQGDPAKGREALETRGCLGCHSIGEGPDRMGDEFAANLSRVGEKAGYDYVVRWVHNPRQRTRPYCTREKRDLGPEDYARHNLPFVFDLDHSTCPNDGSELQVQNMTVMPYQRLSWQEARDIASYLVSLKHGNAAYPSDVSYMDDKRLAAAGRDLVSRYGCAGCHEIRGFEDAQRIGTELTTEASKPIEQLDFGLLQRKAEREDWYNHKGFFEHKLENPAVYDQGRDKAPEDRLRMPNIELTAADRRALTTFLLGSMDSPFGGEFRSIPEQFRYIATDQHRDIQEGWWVIKKYNCMGCHNVEPGQKSTLSGLKRYQDPDWKDQIPPTLIQEGARVSPAWLERFLANPALDEKDTDRNGVRTYLKARMPTFNFSPHEIQVLVRFFQASAGQSSPYIAQKLEPLTDREREMARALFSSRGAPCLKCHLVGDAAHDRFASAPNFLMARDRLKPGWTARWMLDPQVISPGTAMPSGLFRREGDHWVFAGEVPENFKGYTGDHVQLLVRYMFQLTPGEQRQLIQRLPKTTGTQTKAGD